MNEAVEQISIETLRGLVRLDPDTGRLFWIERGVEWFSDTPRRTATHSCAWWNSRFSNKEAFYSDVSDYGTGKIFGRRYYRHVVIFALTHGRWPAGYVDHKDRDRGNDRPYNLREATRRQNNQNVPGRGEASSLKGVSWKKQNQKWCARCSDPTGKRHHLGYFSEVVDAARAYDRAALAWHGEFAHLNFPEDQAK